MEDETSGDYFGLGVGELKDKAVWLEFDVPEFINHQMFTEDLSCARNVLGSGNKTVNNTDKAFFCEAYM